MQHFGHEISFAKWMIVGIPTVIVLLGITWLYLRYVAFRHDLKYLPGGQTLIKQKLDELGKMKYEEKVVQTIFVLASLLWITREFLLKNGKLRHPLQMVRLLYLYQYYYLLFQLKILKNIVVSLTGKLQKSSLGCINFIWWRFSISERYIRKWFSKMVRRTVEIIKWC